MHSDQSNIPSDITSPNLLSQSPITDDFKDIVPDILHDTEVSNAVKSTQDDIDVPVSPRATPTTSSSYGSPPPLEPIGSVDATSLFVRKRDSMLRVLNTVKLSYCLRVRPDVLRDIVSRVVRGLRKETSTSDIQDLLALTANSFTFVHPHYGILAGRAFSDRVYKSTMKTFSSWVRAYGVGERAILRPDFVAAVMAHAPELDGAIVHSRDSEYYFYSLQILYKFYLLRFDGRVVERPQFLYMRIAVSIHGVHLERVLETYELLSTRAYTPATPVLYNAGTLRQNFASCFLYQPPNAPIMSMLATTVRDLSDMWSADGGVGIGLGTIPAACASVQRHSSGPVPVVGVLDTYARFISANRWRRSSSVTAYLPAWHSDVLSFVYSSTHRTSVPSGLKHVFPALWLPDVFMERLASGGSWSLFDPVDVPVLFEVFGDDFAEAYVEYEAAGLAVHQININVLWAAIVDSERETGTPFLLFQDNINSRNNEAHLGIIHSSNLCTEIVQFSSPDHPAVCTLASISLPYFVLPDGVFDHASLHRVTKVVVINTDRCIDLSDYPSPALRDAAIRTRALGIGVQGFADSLMMLRIPFTSAEGRQFNISVFETIYHAALEASCELASVHGPYPAWTGSPASHGVLHMDMWSHPPSSRYDFDALRDRIRRWGLRNSVLTSLMPTATSSKLLGNFESFEPYPSPTVILRTDSGDFPSVCPHLVRELEARGLWTDAVRQEILGSQGSLRTCAGIPDDIKSLYQTVWDINPADLIDMAADRSPFVDQSQSLTLSVRTPSPEVMKTLMLRAWRKGLKTGLYYLRTLHPAFTDMEEVQHLPGDMQARVDCCA